MGGCASISSRSTCSSRSNGEKLPPSCLEMSIFGQKRTRTFSEHITKLQHLGSIPNRIFTNGRSRNSCIFTQQGRKGINQDAMIVWEDFMADDVTFCGVFDGHGPHGHLVARKVSDALPFKVFSFMQSFDSKKNGSGANCCKGDPKSDVIDPEKIGSTENQVDFLWREAFLKSYQSMDKELRSHPHLDCFCSGSTAVTIVKQGSNLFMGNIGDSRAILGSKDNSDKMVAIQLTVDLKPDLPRESERIKRCKGRVFALQDEPEVQRVWLPFDDAPGLAMARAFGDFCLKEYGVISIPDFSHRILTERDKFIVLASDGEHIRDLVGKKYWKIKRKLDGSGVATLHLKTGKEAKVWDVLSNDEVVEIVSSLSTRSSAARVLVETAAREWKSKYPTSKMDDCTVVCLFLDGKMDSESDYEEQGFPSVTLQSNHSGNVAESDGGQNLEPSLSRNFTVRSAEENETYRRIPIDLEGNGETVVSGDTNWSGLDGVTRVNSLVQLPRFSEEMPRA